MRLIADRGAFIQFCALLSGALLFFFIDWAMKVYHYPRIFLFLALILLWVAVVRELNSTAIAMPSRMCRIIRWTHAMTIEFLAFSFFIWMRLASAFRKDNRQILRKPRPILMVHGYLNSGFVWDFHKKYLSQQGFGPIYTIDLKPHFQSIHEHALKVQQKARQIAQETACSDLILIGHSMGGLVSYYYAANLAPGLSVSQIITIGSPLQGTHVAKIGLGQCARDMEIGSKLLQDLHQSIDQCKGVKFYNIAAYPDELIVPCTSAIFKSDPQNQLYLEDIGHAAMLMSKRVAKQLGVWLETA